MSAVELTYDNASLEILPYGLHLRRLALKRRDDAEPFDVLVGPEDASVLLQERSFRNSVVGRYANRLPDKVELPNGTIAQLEGDSEVVLHGGVGCY
jgi:galactose mutarotase-like enzyme